MKRNRGFLTLSTKTLFKAPWDKVNREDNEKQLGNRKTTERKKKSVLIQASLRGFADSVATKRVATFLPMESLAFDL